MLEVVIVYKFTHMVYYGPADASEARKLAMRSAIHREVQSWLASKYTPIIIEKVCIDEDRRINGHVDAVLLGTNRKRL